ncbi:MAG: hypothetical protein QF755_02875 [Candidatus Peribacteraceae bacterium]|nr:hypothetical protein [Candidatus Peribacteraceae bacterium]
MHFYIYYTTYCVLLNTLNTVARNRRNRRFRGIRGVLVFYLLTLLFPLIPLLPFLVEWNTVAKNDRIQLMPDDYKKTMGAHQGNVTEDDQKKAGQAISGKMEDKHKQFILNLIKLIESGEINPMVPQTFVKKEVYDSMPEEWQDKTDLILVNLADEIRMVVDFWKSTETPDESPQLDTMVEALWHSKQKIEVEYDVFKF